MQAQSARALALARWLEQQEQVERVYYPGSKSHPQHELAMAQQSGQRRRGRVVHRRRPGQGGPALARKNAFHVIDSTRSARSPPTSATPRPRSRTRPAPRTAG
jgi:O-succinylhomoserine sulfhydrylase